MKNNTRRRSDCEISLALETFGDMWSLLIVRDIVYYGKKTYGEFLESKEGIATNILASRLAHLEERGVLVRNPCETDRRKEIYTLTEKGLDLIPLLLEIARWSTLHDLSCSASSGWVALLSGDREKLVEQVRVRVRNGDSIFAGRDRLVDGD
jgi:DNA-binding HxlR family transcriptional regulator